MPTPPYLISTHFDSTRLVPSTPRLHLLCPLLSLSLDPYLHALPRGSTPPLPPPNLCPPARSTSRLHHLHVPAHAADSPRLPIPIRLDSKFKSNGLPSSSRPTWIQGSRHPLDWNRTTPRLDSTSSLKAKHPLKSSAPSFPLPSSPPSPSPFFLSPPALLPIPTARTHQLELCPSKPPFQIHAYPL
ncbi:hypothetical protein DFH08DRAFT_437300 [Mycena albidolilacea]|uniref:Uncharacterized protein n=1 Tax=Mycena albidolilacea TaxID=1033008 RepID=A0AAD7EY89_9AGAR|nr:hypothetical protein DFH08DRAFT_437300 [Mycena albidolilacea]